MLPRHDNSKGDPVFSMFFKYASDGRQSGIADPKVDEMIAKASAATGDERAKDWSELFAYLHDEVVPDVLLFHMALRAHGVPKDDLPASAKEAHAIRRLLDWNPVDLSEADILEIYEAAY